MELIQTEYGWLDPETGIEYASDADAYEAKAEARKQSTDDTED